MFHKMCLRERERERERTKWTIFQQINGRERERAKGKIFEQISVCESESKKWGPNNKPEQILKPLQKSVHNITWKPNL